MLAPALRVGAQEGGSITIRLAEAPEDRRDDPRALRYIIDHVAPGEEITRRFEVGNTTGSPLEVDLYVGSATVRDGGFAPMPGRGDGDLAVWGSVHPPTATVPAGGAIGATVTISVPTDAEDGERYGAVLAEARPSSAEGVAVASRVGIRVYLSVGEGAEPVVDFVVGALTASREEDGRPVVRASIENTGGRAVDLRGELLLEDGPGGLSAGPFPADVGTTLGPGDEGEVRIPLDPSIPEGPWRAALTMRSGTTSRAVEATIAFPTEAGTAAEPVTADPVERRRRILAPVAGAVIAVTAAALALHVLGRGRWRRLLRRG